VRGAEQLVWASAVLCALVAIGCGGPSDEGLVVSAQTDFVPVAEFDFVRIRVDGAEAVDRDVSVGDVFTRPRPLHTFEGLGTGRRLIEVSLVRGDRTLVTRRVQVDFRGSQLVNVILARSCLDVECGASESCAGGECVPPSCVDGTEPSCPRPQCTAVEGCSSATSCVQPTCVAGICLEAGDDDACGTNELCVPGIGCISRPRDDDAGASSMDAGGVDAASTTSEDAGTSMDAPTGCSSAAECDDGLSCTTDTCSVDRICVHTPDDARCADSACAPSDPMADPGTGCLPACTAATCVAGPCESATCVAGRCERGSLCAGGEMCCSGVCALDCATVSCAGRSAGTECRASSGPCDPAEVCDGTSPTCPDDVLHGDTHVCRPASGACDVAEVCSTGTASCPADGFAATGTACPSGSCDGLGGCSSACVPGAACSTGNPCERGMMQCAPMRCVAAGAAPAATVCRPAMGACDVEETCGGATTCPPDRFSPSTRECRAQRGVCDRAEMCTGSSADCPGDVREPSGTTCRSAIAGGCDVAEACTGSSDDCPANAFRPSSTVCRAASGACDVEDRCTGSSAVCPADDVQPSGTTCRASAGVCDAVEACDGSSTTCPANGYLTSGVCRAAGSGGCDVAESCNGSGPSCPADGFAAMGTSCRASTGVCDPAETCTGSSGTCPANAFSPASTVCRACDLAESCTGSSATCPADAFRPDTYVCRGAFLDPCNPPELCPGDGAVCPPDDLSPAGTSCDDIRCGGTCNGGGVCTGGFDCLPPTPFCACGVMCSSIAVAC
jgi:hypothetical protein